MEEREWVPFIERRPDEEGLYWWKVPNKEFGKLTTSVCWTDKFQMVGCGHSNAMWPLFSYWDGYNRHVPKGLQWAVSTEEDAKSYEFCDITLKGCPFCGSQPEINWLHKSNYGGSFVGSRIYQANCFWIKCENCGISHTPHWNDLSETVNLWNTRKPEASND